MILEFYINQKYVKIVFKNSLYFNMKYKNIDQSILYIMHSVYVSQQCNREKTLYNRIMIQLYMRQTIFKCIGDVIFLHMLHIPQNQTISQIICLVLFSKVCEQCQV